MHIQCQCGKFQAQLMAFPKHTPGRLVCYCDDCQAYLRCLDRTDLLDAHGGTEVIPAYPVDVQITRGQDHLACLRLSPKGTDRFFASCCNTPIANTRAGTSWVGFFAQAYTAGPGEPQLDQVLGPVRSRIMGRYAKGRPPAGTPDKFNLKAFLSVLPFMLKGKLLGKARPSPFYAQDGVTPISTPRVLSLQERQAATGHGPAGGGKAR